MKIVLRDNKLLYLEDISDAEVNIIAEAFTFENDNKYAQQNTSVYRPWQNKILKFNKIKRTMSRTFLGRLAFFCTERGLPFHVEDLRPKWKYTYADSKLVDKDFLPGITLEDYQIEGIKTGIRCECGIFSLTTGAGKTELIAGLCKAIHCPTIILADMTIVVSQLRDRLQLREVASEIGMFFAGQKPNGEMIIVGSIQSLTPPKSPKEKPERHNYDDDKKHALAVKRWESSIIGYQTRLKNYRMLIECVKKAEMLIVDECVDEHSYINTSKGIKTARSIYDEISNGGEVFARTMGGDHKIIGMSAKYDKAVVVETTRGRTLTTSSNHPFAVLENGHKVYKHASDLKPHDLLLVNNSNVKIDVDWNDKSSVLWYFIGLFIGDGHFLNGKQIKFGVRKDFDDWIKAVSEIDKHFVGEYTSKFNSRGDLVIRLRYPELIDALYLLGFKPGRKMGTIHPKFDIPDHKYVCCILRGLYDAEGSSYPSRVNIDSSDYELTRFIQILLSSLGICSSLFVSSNRDNDKHNVLWRVSVGGFGHTKFMNLVGFGFNRKHSTNDRCLRLHTSNYVNRLEFMEKWRDIIPCMKLCDALSCGHSTVSTSKNGLTNLRQLIDWQNKIVEFSNIEVNTYEEAKKIFGISSQKVADFHDRPMTSVYTDIKNGKDVWADCVQDIKDRLREEIIDTSLVDYAVEPVRSVYMADGVRRLIDFTVENVNNFESNGILVHNCDRSSSSSYRDIIRKVYSGRRKYGFSGTPFDFSKPLANLAVEENFGYVIYQMGRKEVEERGRIVPIKYRMMYYADPEYHFRNKITLEDATNMFMVDNVKLHNMIYGILRCHTGEKNMILVDRIALGENLRDFMLDKGLKSAFICGDTPKKERTAALDDFAAGRLDVLVGGKIVNRGLDIKGGIDNLIVATGGKLRSDFLQKIGRALRVNERGFSYVYDFLFRCNHYLFEHSKARLETIIDAGYESQVNFGSIVMTGQEYVDRKFLPPSPGSSKNKK